MKPAAPPDICCPWALRVIHAVWLVWILIWTLSLTELRTTLLGGALWIAALIVIALVALAELMRAKNKSWLGDFGRPPRFTLHTLAGIAAVAAAGFGLVACFNLDLSNDALFHFGDNAGPMSRWVFIVFFVFGLTAFYGVFAILIGSGLWGKKKLEPQMTQISQFKKEENQSV